jgi:hypothetical protein
MRKGMGHDSTHRDGMSKGMGHDSKNRDGMSKVMGQDNTVSVKMGYEVIWRHA